MTKRKTIAAGVVLTAALLTLAFTGTASGANTVRSSDIVNRTIVEVDVKQNSLTGLNIKNGSINGGDIRQGAITTDQIKAGTISEQDLDKELQSKLNPGPADTGFEADGPYPGETDLGKMEGQGDNSDELVKGDEGKSVQTVWVQCAPKKVAIGGGFHLAADASLTAKKNLHVTASEPAQVRESELLTNPEKIPGDAADSFQPNAWRVDVINEGSDDVVVRPWVVCVYGG